MTDSFSDSPAEATPAPSTRPPRAPTASPGVDPRIDMDAKLAAEIEQALGDMSLEDMLDMAEPAKKSAPASHGGGPAAAPRHERQKKTGTIMSVHGKDVFVEFGPKSQG